MIEKKNCRKVGQIVKTHGVNAELVVRLFDGLSIDMLQTEFLFLDLNGGLVPFFMDEAREKNQTDVLVKLALVRHDKQFAQVMDANVYVPKKGESEQNDVAEAFSAYSLVGYTAATSENGMIGTIVAIKDISKNPLFEIENEGNEILIPVVEEFIAGIDDENQTVIFQLPEGLLDL